MCADAAQTDPYFAKSLCGGGAGERAKIWAFSAFLANLAVFGPLGQFWTNLAKLAIFGNFWDFPNLGQILRDFEGKFGPLAKFGFFWPFRPFLQFLAILVDFGQIWRLWQI